MCSWNYTCWFNILVDCVVVTLYQVLAILIRIYEGNNSERKTMTLLTSSNYPSVFVNNVSKRCHRSFSVKQVSITAMSSSLVWCAIHARGWWWKWLASIAPTELLTTTRRGTPSKSTRKMKDRSSRRLHLQPFSLKNRSVPRRSIPMNVMLESKTTLTKSLKMQPCHLCSQTHSMSFGSSSVFFRCSSSWQLSWSLS